MTPTTQPDTIALTDAKAWIPPFVAGVVCVCAIVFLLIARRRIAKWLIEHPKWPKIFGGIATLSAVAGWYLSGAIDFRDICSDRVPASFGYTLGALIVAISIYLAFAMMVYARDSESGKTQIDLARLQGSNDDHELRRVAIGEIVNSKAESILAAIRRLRASPKPLTRGDIFEIFQPQKQLSQNFIALHKRVRHIIGPKGSLRLAVYFPSDDDQSLRVELSFDGQHSDCIRTPNGKFASHFRLTQNQKCLAVYASTHGGLHVIADTDRVRGQYKSIFSFFEARQRSEIRSILACGYRGNDSDFHPVIVADSDRKGAFKDDDVFKNRLQLELNEFGNRLLYEASVIKLLSL